MLAVQKQRQKEGHKLRVSLDYPINSRLTRDIQRDPVSKTNNTKSTL